MDQSLFPEKPADIREDVVFEHPADVGVGEGQRLVERLEVIMPEGDTRTLDIPAEPGESFDEERFQKRREAVLSRVARALDDDGRGDSPPGVLSRSYALWTYEAERREPRDGSLLERVWAKVKGGRDER